MLIELDINGKHVCREISPAIRLIDFLRDEMSLTGTKEGCGEGECGACTVLVDNKAMNSCLLFVAQVQHSEIMTIEGVRETTLGRKLIRTFSEKGAVQCGFCTPGLIMSAYAYLRNKENPDEAEIKSAISGNLCRCTGYQKVFEAISEAISL